MEMKVVETECSVVEYVIRLATKDLINFICVYKDEGYTYGYSDMSIGDSMYFECETLEDAMRLFDGALQAFKEL